MRKKVVVIGGGVAGLTAAHELIERGFDVTLYERRERVGGKAASKDGPNTGLPTEHGFRFLPGWYRHVPDTMKRIPYKEVLRSVYDNLVPAEINLFASTDREPIPAVLHLPRSMTELRAMAAFPQRLLQLGLTADDIAFFFGKLAEYAMTPESLRVAKFDQQTWWSFMDAQRRSRAFRQYLVDGVTRNTVAAVPTEASAHTIAQVALRTLFDTLTPDTVVDRVLNGPTSEVWIEPWCDYLKERGVEVVTDAELDSIAFADGKVASVHVRLHRVKRASLRAKLAGLRELKAQKAVGRRKRSSSASNVVDSASFISWISEYETHRLCSPTAPVEMKASQAPSQELDRQYELCWNEHQACLLEDAAQNVTADYFVIALPLEQMAYFVNRSPELQRRDHSLVNLLGLSNNLTWMSGIQFYLTEDIKITRGHIDFLDSEWRLTAISQTQFWTDIDMKDRGDGALRGKVRSILSVDISAWDVPGRLHRKSAYASTPQEIAEEVWDQLMRAMNRPGRAKILADSMLLGHKGSGVPVSSYYLDDDIAERLDRKKQSFYQRFDSVRFSAEAAATREAGNDNAFTATFAYGDRMQMNVEPLLVNRAGSATLHPTAKTAISNLFLAGDYVQTTTNIATMEAANESARRAVNEILLDVGFKGSLCQLWPLAPTIDTLLSFLRAVRGLSSNGFPAIRDAPAQLLSGAASVAGRTAQRMIGHFLTRKS